MNKKNTAILKSEYNGIDIFKFVLAIVVVASHTNLFVNVSDSIALNVKSYIFSLVVPFFFIASGFLLGVKINNNKEDTFIILNKKIKSTIKLYLCWTIIYLPITLYGYITNGKGILYNILSFIRGGLLIGENFDSWPLWYLLSTIYSLIFIKIMLKNVKKENNKILIVSAVFILSIIIDWLTDNVNSFSGIIYYIAKLLSITILNGRLLRGVIYIFIGMKLSIINRRINNILKVIILLIMGIIYIFISNYINEFVILISGIILFLLSLDVHFGKIKSIFYRKSSTIIYFTHMIFYFIYSVIIHNEKTYYGISSFIFTLSCTIILSIIIYNIQKNKNTKLLKILFG